VVPGHRSTHGTARRAMAGIILKAWLGLAWQHWDVLKELGPTYLCGRARDGSAVNYELVGHFDHPAMQKRSVSASVPTLRSAPAHSRVGVWQGQGP
jgi:hypothetical protein